MKKVILTLVLALLCSVSSYAQFGRGYRGFVEIGHSFAKADTYHWEDASGSYKESSTNIIDISTTHGYQIIPMLYVGAGVGVSLSDYKREGLTPESSAYAFSNTFVSVPIYLDLRLDFGMSRLSYFADIRGGYHATSHFAHEGGGYFRGAVGLRYALNASLGLNLAVGYQSLANIYNGPALTLGIDF